MVADPLDRQRQLRFQDHAGTHGVEPAAKLLHPLVQRVEEDAVGVDGRDELREHLGVGLGLRGGCPVSQGL